MALATSLGQETSEDQSAEDGLSFIGSKPSWLKIKSIPGGEGCAFDTLL